MRKISLCFLLLLASRASAAAQDVYPKAEIFAGYSYFNASPKTDRISDLIFSNRISQHGFGANVGFNLSKRFGVVVDYSHQSADKRILDLDTDTSTVLYMFGARFSARSDGMTAYGQALIGGARRTAKSSAIDISATDLALAVGGGVQLDINKHIGFRLMQFDYVPTRGADATPGIGRRWSQNFRAQAGFVLKFGG
jgi:opacity protein-like surface antigen